MSLRELIIVTGLSGSGKRSVIKAFEDLGYFCVDNLPVQLIPKLMDLSAASGGELKRFALVVDVREGEFLDDFKNFYRKLKKQKFRSLIIFLEASDEVLVKRFRETRRPHPLATDKPILEGLAQERKRMKEIRELADIVIDTSDLTVHGLKKYILDHFQEKSNGTSLLISVISFGFKYGIPFESDLVFDVRFLPNPNFVRHLKSKNGRDRRVVRYMKSFSETGEVIQKVSDFLSFMIPKYIREGKTYLNIAIGCTGGRHRSVMVSDAVRNAIRKHGYNVKLIHRDIDKESV